MTEPKRLTMRLLGLIGMTTFLVCSSAIANVSVGVNVGYLAPNYGQINGDLEDIWPEVNGSPRFGNGYSLGLKLEYDINCRWRVRGEYVYSSLNSGSWSGGTPTVVEKFVVHKTLDLSVLGLSGIYRFSPEEGFCPYIGAGMALFSTDLTSTFFDDYGWEIYDATSHVSSTGAQVFGGLESKIGKRFSILTEVRYLIGQATGLFSDREFGNTAVDWSGFMGNLGVQYEFD